MSFNQKKAPKNEENGEKMNNLESIFKKEEFLFPIQFGSDDFKNETDIILSLYIKKLKEFLLSLTVVVDLGILQKARIKSMKGE